MVWESSCRPVVITNSTSFGSAATHYYGAVLSGSTAVASSITVYNMSTGITGYCLVDYLVSPTGVGPVATITRSDFCVPRICKEVYVIYSRTDSPSTASIHVA